MKTTRRVVLAAGKTVIAGVTISCAVKLVQPEVPELDLDLVVGTDVPASVGNVLAALDKKYGNRLITEYRKKWSGNNIPGPATLVKGVDDWVPLIGVNIAVNNVIFQDSDAERHLVVNGDHIRLQEAGLLAVADRFLWRQARITQRS